AGLPPKRVCKPLQSLLGSESGAAGRGGRRPGRDMKARSMNERHVQSGSSGATARARASRPTRGCDLRGSSGAAMTETVLALLALTPFIVGAPLLGKQLDIKHKSMDAARYGVWERTVWRSHGSSNRKGDLELLLELRDRTLGNPRAGITPVAHLQSHGISENPLWRDGQRRRLLDYEETGAPASVAH